MIEPEIAFADLEDDMDAGGGHAEIRDQLCAGSVRRKRWTSSTQFVDKGLLERLHNVVNSEFASM